MNGGISKGKILFFLIISLLLIFYVENECILNTYLYISKCVAARVSTSCVLCVGYLMQYFIPTYIIMALRMLARCINTRIDTIG